MNTIKSTPAQIVEITKAARMKSNGRTAYITVKCKTAQGDIVNGINITFASLEAAQDFQNSGAVDFTLYCDSEGNFQGSTKTPVTSRATVMQNMGFDATVVETVRAKNRSIMDKLLAAAKQVEQPVAGM